ncbi:MAG: hypothetical protein SGI77_18605 [Pirellulaceae bacterium]|nr:hypothetical protein [Pirellulaceae bacterium]
MNEATDHSQTHLAVQRERRENFRRGLPAVALLGTAVFIFLFGTLIVRPRLESNYREKCDLAMSAFGILNHGGVAEDSTVGELPIEELRRQLDIIAIYLKRLTEMQSDNSLARYQSGLVAEASSQLYTRKALEAFRSGDTKESEAARSQSLSEQLRAKEIMELIAELDSKESHQAKAWLLARTLERPVYETSELERLANLAQNILDSSPENTIAIARLGQVRIAQAYAVVSDLDRGTRETYLREAIESLSSIESPSLVEQALLAEAVDAFDSEAAIEKSIQVSQRFWMNTAAKSNSPELIAAMFGCLIRQGSLKEAHALIVERFAGLSPNDQIVVRGLCSDFCLRNIVCQITFPIAGRRSTSINALSIAARLDATSVKLVDTLEQVVLSDEKSDEIYRALSLAVQEGSDNGLLHLIVAFRAALKENWTESRAELQQAFQIDVSLGTVGSVLVSRFVDKDIADIAFGMRFLEQMARVAPDSLNIWYTRSLFCEKHGELEKAVECLERILGNSPQSVEILDKLESLYVRLNKSADIHRIQRLKSEIRTPNQK